MDKQILDSRGDVIRIDDTPFFGFGDTLLGNLLWSFAEGRVTRTKIQSLLWNMCNYACGEDASSLSVSIDAFDTSEIHVVFVLDPKNKPLADTIDYLREVILWHFTGACGMDLSRACVRIAHLQPDAAQ